MSTASERGWPIVYAHLRYAEPEAAIDWLLRVFGFREVSRASHPERGLIVSELEGPLGGTIMVARLDDEFLGLLRRRLPDNRDLDVTPYPWPSSSVSIAVDDIDAHYLHAVSEGATTLDEPTDQPWGIRTYAAVDIGGHLWQFAQQLRLVTPEGWGAIRRSET
jgi:uncharacterized glyoxalase superfamily protein PhnB